MLKKQEFYKLLEKGPLFLDGATGSNLQKAGMPRGCCTEQWILDHPTALAALQGRYADAGSHIVYAPTFQAQPIALAKVGLEQSTEKSTKALWSLVGKVPPAVSLPAILPPLPPLPTASMRAIWS